MHALSRVKGAPAAMGAARERGRQQPTFPLQNDGDDYVSQLRRGDGPKPKQSLILDAQEQPGGGGHCCVRASNIFLCVMTTSVVHMWPCLPANSFAWTS